MAHPVTTRRQQKTDVAVIILAAGLGTRMKSDKAKVLHELMDRAMILYVVETAQQVVGDNIIVVVGHQAESVESTVSSHAKVQYALQREQMGTGHAVQTAVPLLGDQITDVVILCGDVPLLTPRTVSTLVDDHRRTAHDITVLAVNIEEPLGYGRLVLDEKNAVRKIVEEADASDEQKQIQTINTGIYCVKKETLLDTIYRLQPANQQKELYLTDIVEIGNRREKMIGVVYGNDTDETIGVNTIEDLSNAECLLKARMMKKS
jgi:bifunctional UDP-N-acetylglucosamine pyrophosphorylase/glucosamine-1-phosphate N-acetyltransferase/UDP-N-acetylglucosamine pyrophosphorylase